MKVKDIVSEDGPIAGQPQIGKVTKTQPGVGGAPGTVTVAMPNGVNQEIPSNLITMGPDGKAMVNQQQQQQPNQQTTQTPAPNGQPPVSMGTDIAVSEEPATRDSSPVNTSVNPPMVMNNGNQGGVPLTVTSTGGPIDADLITRSTDFQQQFVTANGKKYLALINAKKCVVSPQDYQEITGRAPLNPIRGGMAAQSAVKTGIPITPLKESAEVARIKLLSGL
jgi:hypothetical protein